MSEHASNPGAAPGTTGGVEQAGRTPPWWLLAGAGVLTQFLMMVNGIIAARMLGVDGRGQVVLVAIIATTASQLTLGGGLPNAITRQLAERRVTARDGLRGLLGRWTVWGVLAGVVAAGYFLVLEWDRPAALKWALAVTVVLMCLQTIASRVLMGAMLGEGTEPVSIALTSLLPQTLVVLITGTALAVGADWNAVELLAVTIGCTGLVLLARLRTLRRPTGRREDRLDRSGLARLARRTHVGSVGPIDGLAIDRLLVGSLLGSYQLGLYSAAFALGGLTTIFGQALAMLALPRVTVTQAEPDEQRRFVRGWLLLSAALISVVVVGLVLVTAPVIRLTFGPDFLPATEAARWLLVASGLLGFRRVLIAILQGRDRGGFASVVELALTPLVVVGIVLAAMADNLVLVSVTMTAVGAASCLILGVAVARTAPPR